MKIVILAGGFGTRLRSVVKDVPKPMADITGTPFLELLMRNLIHYGADSFYLCVGYKKESITTHFGETFLGVPVFYSVEAEPLGTGGAIKKAFDTFGLENAVVLNGDTFVQMDYAAFYLENKGKVLSLALREVPDTSRYGRVETRNGAIAAIKEKKDSSGAGDINAGVYLIDRRLWKGKSLPEAFSFETELLEPCASSLELGAYKADGYFIDIGIPEDYLRAQNELKKVLDRQ